MIKVAHCIVGLEVGGAEMMLYKTVTQMDQHRFPSFVISTSTRGPIGARLEQAGIPVLSLGQRPGVPNPHAIWQLYRILRREKPTLLQVYMYQANFYGLFAAWLARVPVVWGIRCADMDFRFYNPLSGFLFQIDRWLSRFPAAIVVNSNAGRQYHIAQGYDGRRMVVIPNGFEIERFRPNREDRQSVRVELGLPDGALLVGRFARFDPMKDYATLLQAAGEVVKHYPRVFFVFAGMGTNPENQVLATAIAERGLQDRVLLLGHRDDVPRLMAGLDISVSSSISEGFPNVVGEAMACGVPCVVTDVGDSAFLVGDTGIVVPPKNSHALAEGMEKLIRLKPQERAHLGDAARQRVAENFEIGAVTRQLEKLYDDVIAKRNIESCAA